MGTTKINSVELDELRNYIDNYYISSCMCDDVDKFKSEFIQVVKNMIRVTGSLEAAKNHFKTTCKILFYN